VKSVIQNHVNLPGHKCGLYITHNEHRNFYQTASKHIAESESVGNPLNWKDEASKQRAIDMDEIWTIQWYPETPVGFISASAPTLEEALEFANEIG